MAALAAGVTDLRVGAGQGEAAVGGTAEMVGLVGMALGTGLRANVLGSGDVGRDHNCAVHRNAGDKEKAPHSESAEE
jgi:hypothetical protein